MATATTTKPIDGLSIAGRAAAFGELRQIIERELAGKPAKSDAERKRELCDALNVRPNKVAEFRAALAYWKEEAKANEDANAVLAASKTEQLESEWNRGTDAYERTFAKRASLKEQIEEGRTADRSARSEKERSSQRMGDIEKYYPAMFGHPEASSTEAPAFVRMEIASIAKRLDSEKK